MSRNGVAVSSSKRGLDGFIVGSGVTMDVDQAVCVSTAQKRKRFSPIVWDKEDYRSKGYGKVTASNADPLNQPCGKVKYEVTDSPAGMNSSLTYQDCSSADQEPGQLDEEDFSHAPNIMNSRWASDDDQQDEDLQDVECRKNKSIGTPECVGRSSVSRSGNIHAASSGSGSEVVQGDYLEAMEVDDDKSLSEKEIDYDDISVVGICEEPTGNMFPECRSVYEFEKLGKISEGSYGVVFRARDKKTGDLVALKKLKMGKEREGFPLYYLREISIMRSFNHPSVLGVKEVVVDESDHGFGNVYMVMEYMEHDLKALLDSRKQPFSQSEVKCLMLQLLEGVEYLHDNWVLHRDLKTANLLFSNQGDLKICDFGMARQYSSPLKPYTSLVVTLWYRAPELLLGATEYSTAVDMWSVGCIMAELLAGKPMFDGRTEASQLDKIFRTLGTPTEKIWPGYSNLPGAKVNFVHQPYNMLQKKFPRTSFTGSPVLSDLGLDLLSKLLTYDPEKRITAKDALEHAWFREVPLAKSKEFMPTFPAQTTK